MQLESDGVSSWSPAFVGAVVTDCKIILLNHAKVPLHETDMRNSHGFGHKCSSDAFAIITLAGWYPICLSGADKKLPSTKCLSQVEVTTWDMFVPNRYLPEHTCQGGVNLKAGRGSEGLAYELGRVCCPSV